MIRPLREGIQAYLEEMPPTLRDFMAMNFLLSARVAGLRVYADPLSQPIAQKAALAYAASAYDPPRRS